MQATAQAVKSGRLLYSAHANSRMKKRRIIKAEVEHILSHGHHEARKDHFNEEFSAWDYAVRGKTLDGRNLRIVVAFVDPNVLVVTTIDLNTKDE
jgi:hypothetical protein